MSDEEDDFARPTSGTADDSHADEESHSHEEPNESGDRDETKDARDHEGSQQDTGEPINEEVHTELDRLDEAVEQTRERVDDLEVMFEDYKRRNEHEHDELRKYSIVEFSREMLKIRDNLQNAIEMEDLEEGTERRLGVVVKQFDDKFTSGRIEKIDPEQGDNYDNERHRMIGKEPSESLDTHQILRVLEPGYVVADRVIRSARVIVAE